MCVRLFLIIFVTSTIKILLWHVKLCLVNFDQTSILRGFKRGSRDAARAVKSLRWSTD